MYVDNEKMFRNLFNLIWQIHWLRDNVDEQIGCETLKPLLCPLDYQAPNWRWSRAWLTSHTLWFSIQYPHGFSKFAFKDLVVLAFVFFNFFYFEFQLPLAYTCTMVDIQNSKLLRKFINIKVFITIANIHVCINTTSIPLAC